MSANGISTLETKELRQKAKLELAATNRAATGRRSIYDLEELPTRYSDDDVVDNPNPDGLLEGRPWVDISRTNLQFYIDPSATASYPGTGTTVTDLSTNAYDTARLVNGVGFSSTDADGSFTFDGTDDYIDTNQSLASDGDFTINAWFKCSDVTGYRMIVSKETTAGRPWNYRMYIAQTTGKLVFDVATISSGPSIVGGTTVSDGTWRMGTVVRNKTTDKVYVYIDGVSDATPVTDGVTGVGNSQEVWIGRSAYTGETPTGSYPYKGSLGEIMIYNRALSAAEIAITFRATRSRYGV